MSEIILQQTRVDQGLSYYLKFTEAFPKVEDLAKAPEEKVLKLWQGLGYYSRARNLQFSAKMIMNEFGGEFPKTYNDILKLKGVGEYTAAAVSSFAFQEHEAVVDGNVFRVLARYFDISEPIDIGSGKKLFTNLAKELLPKNEADIHNQAIMEFGALQCTPKSPNCSECPLNISCKGKHHQQTLPVKSKKIKKRNRFFNYIDFITEDKLYLRKRSGKDIWQSLFEPPMFETDSELSNITKKDYSILPQKFEIKEVTEMKHILTHQNIYAKFWKITGSPENLPNEYEAVENSKLDDYAIPKLVDNYLNL